MFCSRCGTENDNRATQCQRCAAPLQPPGSGALPPAPAGWGAQPPQPPPPPPGFGGQQGWGQPQPAYAYPQRPNVPNYLVQSILATIFCCIPLGIVSIVFASQVNGKLERGDVAGAMESSGKAKTWAWVAFGVGLAINLVWFAVSVLGALAGVDG